MGDRLRFENAWSRAPLPRGSIRVEVRAAKSYTTGSSLMRCERIDSVVFDLRVPWQGVPDSLDWCGLGAAALEATGATTVACLGGGPVVGEEFRAAQVAPPAAQGHGNGNTKLLRV